MHETNLASLPTPPSPPVQAFHRHSPHSHYQYFFSPHNTPAPMVITLIPALWPADTGEARLCADPVEAVMDTSILVSD